MNWDDYIYPVEISYNREYLNQMIQKVQYWPMYSSDRGKTFFSNHRDIYFPVNAEAIRIKNSLIESTTFSFSWVPVGHQTGWHSDQNRGCTLILPIDQEPHLIEFEIDGEVLSYYYSQPVLTNAKTWHNGVNHSENERYNLLFHYDKSYQDVVDMARNNQLVTVWQQDYNVFADIKYQLITDFYRCHNDIDHANVMFTHDRMQAESFNGLSILLGTQSQTVANITYSDDTSELDILNAIEFILNSSSNVRHIHLGEP